MTPTDYRSIGDDNCTTLMRAYRVRNGSERIVERMGKLVYIVEMAQKQSTTVRQIGAAYMSSTLGILII